MKIAVWPDGFWIDLSEDSIEGYVEVGSGCARSDDYQVLEVPDEVDDVDEWLVGKF